MVGRGSSRMRNKYPGRRVDLRVDWLELVRYVRCSRITSVSPNGTAFMDVTFGAGQPANVSVGGPMLRWYMICAPHLVMGSVGEAEKRPEGPRKQKAHWTDRQMTDKPERTGPLFDKQVSCDSDGDGTPIQWLSKNLTLAPLLSTCESHLTRQRRARNNLNLKHTRYATATKAFRLWG